MVILELNPQKKHLTELVFEDDSVLLDREVVELWRLAVGMNITQERLCELQYESQVTRAKNRALWHLARRDWAKKEMFYKLRRDFDESAVLEALEALEEMGYIDDRRFAELYAQDLLNFKQLSAKGIKFELIKKGVEREIAEEYAESVTAEIDSSAAVLEIIRQRYSGFILCEKTKRRMYAALIRKGYSYDDINKAVDEFEMEED